MCVAALASSITFLKYTDALCLATSCVKDRNEHVALRSKADCVRLQHESLTRMGTPKNIIFQHVKELSYEVTSYKKLSVLLRSLPIISL